MASNDPPLAGARGLFVAAAFVIVVAGMRQASTLILPFLVAVFLTILCLPVVRWLRKRRIPSGLAILLVLLGVAGLVGLAGLFVGTSVSQFSAALPEYKKLLAGSVADASGWLEARGIELSRDSFAQYANPAAAMEYVNTVFDAFASTLSYMLLVVLTVVFLLIEATCLPQKMRLAMNDANADLSGVAKAAYEVQRYMALKSALSLGTGILCGVWVWVLGVDFPVLWGLVAFLLNFVPNLGSILAAIPAVLMALVQYGTGRALLVGAGYVAINFVVGNIVEPRLMGRSLGLSPLVVFTSLIFWGWIWGPVGMLLSVPLTVVIKIFLENSPEFRWLAVLLGPSPDAPAT